MRVVQDHQMPRPLLLLPPGEVDRLRATTLTYDDVGATRSSDPVGWDRLEHRVTLGTGRACFEAAARLLLTWQVQRRSGIRVAASSPQVHAEAVAVLRLGIGPVGINAPVRVVYVLDEPDRQGFAYGTLAGHPETGEELFLVERATDDTVTASIRAFSRPASRLARLVPPATRSVQHWMAKRYLAALRP
jgi:uncharacterized protein (UPF0548 family)